MGSQTRLSGELSVPGCAYHVLKRMKGLGVEVQDLLIGKQHIVEQLEQKHYASCRYAKEIIIYIHKDVCRKQMFMVCTNT